MKSKVLIATVPGMIEEKDWKTLSEKADVEYLEKDSINQDELLNAISDKEYVMLNFDIVKKLDESFYKTISEEKYPLKALSTDITGMEWADPESAKKYGIKLLYVPHYSTISVAEFTLTTLLILVKKLHLVFNQDDPAEVKPIKNNTVKDKTIGIIGLGSIGIRMAEICHGLGMNVIAYNRTEKDIPNVKMLSLENVCKESDYISIHLKNTEETKEIITDNLMRSMKEGVIIVNQATNSLIDTEALIKHVKSGHIAGYSATAEGIETDEANDLPQIMLLPAQAWFTDDSLSNLKKIWIDNIIQAMEGNIQNLAY